MKAYPSGKGYKVGIYVRESRDENGEEYETIETQRDMLIDFVHREKLGTAVAVYMDDNISGSVFERDGINRMKEDVISGNVDMLLLKDLSRLGRNNARTLLFLDYLEENGVRVITSDGRYDSSKDNDTVGIETWYNERYVRDISRKIRANLRFKREKGEYLGHAPFGYIKSEDEKNKLAVNEEEAPIVREIYTLYRKGYGYSSIASILEQKGRRAPQSSWNASTVQRILTNRAYIGDTVQGISERISFKSKKARRLPSERWVITAATHQPIIEAEEFLEVQKLRKAKNCGCGGHKGQIHLLAGITYCGCCGSRMHAKIRNGKTGYICGNYGRKGLKACRSHYIAEEFLLEVLKGKILAIFRDFEAKAADLLRRELRTAKGTADRRERLSAQLSGKYRQQELLYRDRLEGRVSLQLFERINIGIEERIRSLKEELAGCETEKEAADPVELIRNTAAEIRENGPAKELIGLLTERITVYDREDFTKLNYLELLSGTELKEEYGIQGAVIIDLRISEI